MAVPTTPQIIERIQSADNLPSLPKVAIEVLRLTRADDVSMAEIAGVVQQDPALTAKLLKVVNSSLFGMSRRISSLQQAVVVLGLRTVKVMALSFSLVDMMNKDKSGGFDYPAYWRRSLTTAVSARLIARNIRRTVADEAFATGLLCDIGMLAAVRCATKLYAPVLEKYDPRGETIQAVEQDVLGLTHETISFELLSHWGLPEDPCIAVRSHHAPFDHSASDDPAQAGLTKTIRAAAMIADVFCSETRAHQLAVVKDEIVKGLPMAESVLQESLHTLDSHIRETASLFALDIGSTRNYQEIQAEAAAQLARLGMPVEVQRTRTGEHEQAVPQKVEESKEQNRQLAPQATIDALTGIANQSALEQHLKQDCAKALHDKTPLGIIILNLDRFKKLNDTFGHRVGDDALKQVGACLSNIADETKFAARYGGEEFALVITEATERELHDLAEEIRLAIHRMRISYGQKNIAITASLGAAYMKGDDPALQPNQLIELADRCLHEAKRSGRNRVVLKQAAQAAEPDPHHQ